jgi:hypothetical protein
MERRWLSVANSYEIAELLSKPVSKQQCSLSSD